MQLLLGKKKQGLIHVLAPCGKVRFELGGAQQHVVSHTKGYEGAPQRLEYSRVCVSVMNRTVFLGHLLSHGLLGKFCELSLSSLATIKQVMSLELTGRCTYEYKDKMGHDMIAA